MIYRLIRWLLVVLIATAIVLLLGKLAQSNRQDRLATGADQPINVAASAKSQMGARKR